MNKADLIEMVSSEIGESKAGAERAVNAVLNCIQKGVKKDKNCQIIGFGTFSVAARKARTGRNPKTGETIEIAASRAAKFKPGKTLKDSVK